MPYQKEAFLPPVGSLTFYESLFPYPIQPFPPLSPTTNPPPLSDRQIPVHRIVGKIPPFFFETEGKCTRIEGGRNFFKERPAKERFTNIFA